MTAETFLTLFPQSIDLFFRVPRFRESASTTLPGGQKPPHIVGNIILLFH